jgi:DDE superfamily endonuclease
MSDSDDSDYANLLIFTSDEILNHGLKLLGWTDKKLARESKHKHEKQANWFSCEYGAKPHVVAQIWIDLQRTEIEDARIIAATEDELTQVLYTLQLLKSYPTEGQRQNKWHACDRVLRDKCWSMLLRLQALKATKIVWPTDEELGDDIFVGAIDGTHIKTEEPMHPEFPKDPKAYSKKNHSAGLTYELVTSLSHSRIIWMNGPFPASTHDKAMFMAPGGLREKLQGTGLRLIGDSGYSGHDDFISRANSKDAPEVGKFKTRARLRHERVNGMIKTLRCTDSARFRHKGNHKGQPKFKICFEAAVVITQYKMENGEPLFDI